MYECHNCGGYFHHDDAPPIEIDGHLVCPECVCSECDGTGLTEIAIGVDGYGDRPAARADVEVECGYCGGTGMEPLDEEA